MKKFIPLTLIAILLEFSTTQAQTIKSNSPSTQPIEQTQVEKSPAVDSKSTDQPRTTRRGPNHTPDQSKSGDVESENKSVKRGPSDDQIRHAEDRSNGKAFSGKSKNKLDKKKAHKKNHSHDKKREHQHKNKMKNVKPENRSKKSDRN